MTFHTTYNTALTLCIDIELNFLFYVTNNDQRISPTLMDG